MSDEQKKPVTVWGSYGIMQIDRETGRVIEYDPEVGEGPAEYDDIVAVDLEVFIEKHGELPGAIDIIRLNFWTNTGEYVKAEEPSYDAGIIYEPRRG